MSTYPPQYPYAPAPPQTRPAGLAIAGLVLGIVGIPFGWLWIIPPILGVVFGHIGLWQINHSNGLRSGRGLAIAGFVCGYVGLAFWGLIFIALLADA